MEKEIEFCDGCKIKISNKMDLRLPHGYIVKFKDALGNTLRVCNMI
jgi:hypothetical protein